MQYSSCTEDVLFTYESLKVASVFTSPFCVWRTYHLFCAALKYCDSGDDVTPRNILCKEVRQQHCTAEWRILEVNNRSDGLIDCHGLGETGHPNCSEQFGLANNNSICLPLCKEFSQHGKKFTHTVVKLNAFVHLVNMLGGILVFIACLWNRSKM